MNNVLILESDQLRMITGKVRWSAQARVLRQMGFEVKVRPDGFPLVDIDNYRRVMGAVDPRKPERVTLHLEDV